MGAIPHRNQCLQAWIRNPLACGFALPRAFPNLRCRSRCGNKKNPPLWAKRGGGVKGGTRTSSPRSPRGDSVKGGKAVPIRATRKRRAGRRSFQEKEKVVVAPGRQPQY